MADACGKKGKWEIFMVIFGLAAGIRRKIGR